MNKKDTYLWLLSIGGVGDRTIEKIEENVENIENLISPRCLNRKAVV